LSASRSWRAVIPFTYTGRSGIEFARARQATHHDGIKPASWTSRTTVATAAASSPRRDAELLASAIRLALHLHEAQRVERTHQAHTGQELGDATPFPS
jgi:hypothetical protein